MYRHALFTTIVVARRKTGLFYHAEANVRLVSNLCKMVKLPDNLNSLLLSAGKTVKTSSGSAVNIIICLFTVGSEQLFSFAVFSCPCTLNSTSTMLGVAENKVYGGVYICVPAVALFMLGIAMNQKTWKLMTGCMRRHEKAARGIAAGCLTLMEIIMQAMVAPCAWIAIALLDGKYYACAATDNVYDMSCKALTRAAKNKVRYTVGYERNLQKSQTIGWIFIVVVLFIGSVVYMINRWFSKLTYLHRNYMLWYNEIEDKKFEALAKEQIEDEAEQNIKNFLAEKRKKLSWDKISTVFNLVRDRGGYAIYSRLDEWNEVHPLSDNDNDEHSKSSGGSKDQPPSVDDAGFVSSNEIKNEGPTLDANEIEMQAIDNSRHPRTHLGRDSSKKPLLEVDGITRNEKC